MELWLARDVQHLLGYSKSEVERAVPMAPTSGAIHRPMAAGTAVGGGIRDRMRAEDALRNG